MPIFMVKLNRFFFLLSVFEIILVYFAADSILIRENDRQIVLLISIKKNNNQNRNEIRSLG
jgi:hypothetical protein